MSKAETLPLLLKQLGLPCMLQKWLGQETIAQEKSWRHAEYLASLCEYEINNRYEKRVARHTKESKLAPGKTLSSFDFTKVPSIDKRVIEALAENPGWVKEANNLVIFGPSGVGKTHLASAIGHRLIELGVRCYFASTTHVVQQLQVAKQEYKLAQALNKLSRYPLLILDDIGYAKKDDQETSVLFELIAERYETSSLIITANQPFSEWDSIFPDNMMAVAAVDRLVHHATILNITEESYRRNASTSTERSKGSVEESK